VSENVAYGHFSPPDGHVRKNTLSDAGEQAAKARTMWLRPIRNDPRFVESGRGIHRSVHLHSRPVSNILEGSSKPATLSLSANLGRIPVAVKFPTVLPPDETP